MTHLLYPGQSGLKAILKAGVFCVFIVMAQGLFGQVRTSVITGNWNNNATWDCGCVPAPGEDAVIANGTTVTMTNNESINSLTVNAGATLANGKNDLSMTGNLKVDGSIVDKGKIFMNGVGTTISGTGVLTDVRKIDINNGNQTILPGTDLNLMRADININGGFTVTNQGTITVDRKIKGNSAASTWVNDVNATLNIGRDLFKNNGTLVASATGNVINYTRAKNQKIKTPAGGQYWNLGVANGGTKTVLGNLDINGNLTNQYSTLDANGFNINLAGDWTSTYGTFLAGTQTVTFDGSADQTITSTDPQTFFDMVVNKAGGELVYNSSDTVANSLTMTSGNIVTGSNTLLLGTGLTNPGTFNHTSGTIVGKFERWLTATATAYQFPMGTATYYRPASLTFNALTGGTLTLEFVEDFPTNNGLPLLDGVDSVFNTFDEGYWALTASNGLSSTDYNISLTGNGFSSYAINGSTRVLTRTNAGNNWMADGTHVAATGTTANRNNITTLDAQFAFGDTTSCYSSPLVISVAGADSVCTGTLGAGYSVTNNPGSVYSWIITGGTQASGGNTNSITVDWGTTGMAGSVKVQEYTGCAYGAPAMLAVNLHTLPTSSIIGNTDVAQNSTGEIYSVTANTGYTYTWAVTGGSIATGQGTDSISVNWGAAGTGTVSVVGSTSCGSAPAQNMTVTIYETINSFMTGNWSTPATWDCNCVPNKASNVIINNGDVVTMMNKIDVNHLQINAGGTLDDGGNKLRIYGNLTLNGSYVGSNRIELRGTNVVVDGTGSFAGHSGDLLFRDGLKTIASTAVLNKANGLVQVKKNTIVRNEGNFSVGTDLTGSSATNSKWVNGANSVLNVGGVNLNTGILMASDNGNTVNYNGAGNQNIKQPQNFQYFNLTASGGGTKTMQTAIDVNGDVNISSTLNANNLNINLAGNWSNTGTFTAGAALVTFDGTGIQTVTNTVGENFNDVTVNTGATMQVPTASIVAINNVLTNNGTIDNDGTLTFVNGYDAQPGTLSGNGTHVLSGGNWNLTGTFLPDNGTVSFTGTLAQTIQGPTTFYNLSVNNPAGVSIIAGVHNLLNIMTLTNGIFNTNNALTLISDANGTASLAEIQPTADIVGNITMQRYIAPAPTSWRFLSSACSGQTLADWDDDLVTSGFPGSDYPSFPFISIYHYDETQLGNKDGSWNYPPATNITDPILTDKGYWVYVGPVPLTFDATGPANKFTQNINVTWTNSGSVADDGWCLIPNPYPCAIDWDAATGWTKTNVDNAIHIWNPSNQQYAAYVAGVGVNGGSRYVPSQQAFYVKTNAASPVLIATEAVKAPVQQPFFRMAASADAASSTGPLLRLKLNGLTFADETVLRFKTGATTGADSDYDAVKFQTFESAAPTLSTISDSTDFAVNTLPGLVNDVTIPVRVKVGTSGTYAITATDLSGMPMSSCILLEDLLTGVQTDLRTNTSYSFNILDTTSAPRFLLHVGTPIEKESMPVTCNASNDGMAIARGTGIPPWDYEWRDEQDTVLQTSTGMMTADTLFNLPAGTYKVAITGGGGLCNSATDTIVVTEPEVINTNAASTNVLCNGGNDGTATVVPTGGVGECTYLWSTGGANATETGLAVGTYYVTIADANGCTTTDSMVITQPSLLATSIAMTPGHGTCDGSATITVGGGTPGYAYAWSNGDNTATADSLCTGIQYVTVTDDNGCATMDSVIVTSTALPEVHVIDDGLALFPNPTNGNFSIEIAVDGKQDIETRITNTLGQVVFYEKITAFAGLHRRTYDLSKEAKGIYQFELITQEERFIQKITIR